jgi:hypothetical protein
MVLSGITKLNEEYLGGSNISSNLPHLHYGAIMVNPQRFSQTIHEQYIGKITVRLDDGKKAREEHRQVTFVHVMNLHVCYEYLRTFVTGVKYIPCSMLLRYDYPIARGTQGSTLIMTSGECLETTVCKRAALLVAGAEEKRFAHAMTSQNWTEFIDNKRMCKEAFRLL